MYKKIIGIILSCMLLILSGCSTGKLPVTSHVRENSNIALINRVAVLPFTGTARAERIRELTVTQLLANKNFDVVDIGNVDVFLRNQALPPGVPIDAFTIRRLGESLKVDAIILGSVEQVFKTQGGSSFSEITITMRLIDCKTALLIWQATGKATGYSLLDRLFGVASKDSFEVTLELLGDLFATFYE